MSRVFVNHDASVGACAFAGDIMHGVFGGLWVCVHTCTYFLVSVLFSLRCWHCKDRLAGNRIFFKENSDFKKTTYWGKSGAHHKSSRCQNWCYIFPPISRQSGVLGFFASGHFKLKIELFFSPPLPLYLPKYNIWIINWPKVKPVARSNTFIQGSRLFEDKCDDGWYLTCVDYCRGGEWDSEPQICFFLLMNYSTGSLLQPEQCLSITEMLIFTTSCSFLSFPLRH